MAIFGMHQAKTQLSRLVRLVEEGGDVLITRAGKPVARLVRIGATPLPRRPGSLKGVLRVDAAAEPSSRDVHTDRSTG